MKISFIPMEFGSTCCIAIIIILIVFLVIVPKLLTGLIKLVIFLILLAILIGVVLAMFGYIHVPEGVEGVLLPQLL